MQRLMIIIGCVVLLSGCMDGTVSPTSTSYLPLSVGNSWKLVPMNDPASGTYTFWRVTNTVEFEGETWYEMVRGYANPVEVIGDTSYYRVDANGYVYVRREGVEFVENDFRLNGEHGDTWTYDFQNTEISIALSEVLLKIGDRQLNCKAYYRDIAAWADEENTTTLARGIGIAKTYSDAWGNGSILKEAIIDGNKITF